MSTSLNSPAIPPSSHWSLALLLIRIASALTFLYHGSAILFGAFGGPGPERFAGFLHAPVVVGYLVGLAQVAGGLAFLTGVLIRLGAVCVIIVMLGAIFLVHLPHGFDVSKNGMEYALTELLIGDRALADGRWRIFSGGHFARLTPEIVIAAIHERRRLGLKP